MTQAVTQVSVKCHEGNFQPAEREDTHLIQPTTKRFIWNGTQLRTLPSTCLTSKILALNNFVETVDIWCVKNSCSLLLSRPHWHGNVIYGYTPESNFGDACPLSVGYQILKCFHQVDLTETTSCTFPALVPPSNPFLMCDLVKSLHVSKPWFPPYKVRINILLPTLREKYCSPQFWWFNEIIYMTTPSFHSGYSVTGQVIGI